jgi:HD-GYP domain-containing protein (c-di-GMP phosphodiesterase class II)
MKPKGDPATGSRPGGRRAEMEDHRDILRALNESGTLSEKLRAIHQLLRDRQDFVDRIAVATYDPKTDLLKTFLHSSGEDDPLSLYQAKLGESLSLREIMETRRPRALNDLAALDPGEKEHARRIAAQGYRSSYTLPMFDNGAFFGFVFFDSYRKGAFRMEVLGDLDLFGHLISLVVINNLTSIRTMLATVKAARDITAFRDTELGAHLDRMAHYSRLIAKGLAGTYRFNDEFIEYIFLFSPLHDIGKIGMPDAILQKADRLNPQEFELMKTHSEKGRQIIDAMLRDFGLDSVQHIDILRNIAEYHHEAVDGTGYPRGIQGEAIPIEARIIAVADIFDALTNQRAYKKAWSNAEAFALLRQLAGKQLDRDCVKALIQNADAIEEIQQRFRDREPVTD